MSRADNLSPILNAEHMDFYYGNRQVLTDISIEVHGGEYLSLIGPNGSGKSTLFRILSGLAAPAKGRATYRGQIIHKMSPGYRAQCIAIVQQNTPQRIPFTCLENILLGLHPHLGRFETISDTQYAKVRQLMDATDTWRMSEQPVSQLSGGEGQRVALCRALVQEPEVLLLDEAMSELDVAARMKMSELLKQLCTDTGLAVVAVHHDLNLAYRFSDKICVLKEGSCAGFGSPKSVMTEDLFRHVFHVKAEVFENKGFFIQNTL